MLEQFRNHLQNSGLIPEGARVLVGYSGGADSTCLLHMLKALDVDVVAGHLHHGQREEADREMALCEAFCQSLDVPFLSGRADVPRMKEELKIGLEEAGRMARYNFLGQAARRVECNLIATAHTATDSVETILFNLTRGTGPSGLSGIEENRNGIIRPLLPFSREETRSYCSENGLWFHDDPCNESLDFARARMRLRITPELGHINPAYERAILRCAKILRDEDRFLDSAAAAALERSERPLNGQLGFLTKDVEIALDRGSMGELPGVLFRRACRLAFGALGGSLDYDQAVNLEQMFAHQESGSITGEEGSVVAEWKDQTLHFRQLAPTEPFRFNISRPGETESEEFGWRISCFESEASESRNERGSLRVELCIESLKGDLYFRSVQPGDAMQPLGFEGTRKLSDLLSEAKLTKAARARLPIICDFMGPIWAPGVCLSNKIDKRSTSERVLVLAFEPIVGFSEPSNVPRRESV